MALPNGLSIAVFGGENGAGEKFTDGLSAQTGGAVSAAQDLDELGKMIGSGYFRKTLLL